MDKRFLKSWSNKFLNFFKALAHNIASKAKELGDLVTPIPKARKYPVVFTANELALIRSYHGLKRKHLVKELKLRYYQHRQKYSKGQSPSSN